MLVGDGDESCSVVLYGISIPCRTRFIAVTISRVYCVAVRTQWLDESIVIPTCFCSLPVVLASAHHSLVSQPQGHASCLSNASR